MKGIVVCHKIQNPFVVVKDVVLEAYVNALGTLLGISVN